MAPVSLCLSLLSAGLVIGAATGCVPARSGSSSPEREPNYLKGQDLIARLDYPAAIKSFERAVAINPDFAPPRFELGFLYENHLDDPATAIYHFERFLELQPASDKATIIRQHVDDCKMELAKRFLIPPVAPSVRKEMESLKSEVKRLKLENAMLQRQIQTAAVQPIEEPPSSQFASLGPAIALTSSTPPLLRVSTEAPVPPEERSASRKHEVKNGDYPARIARIYGIKLENLLQANPGLNPRHLKIGQKISIPMSD